MSGRKLFTVEMGVRLKSFRLRAGLTQNEVAARMGFSAAPDHGVSSALAARSQLSAERLDFSFKPLQVVCAAGNDRQSEDLRDFIRMSRPDRFLDLRE